MRASLVASVAIATGACAAFDRAGAADSIASTAQLRAARVASGGFSLLSYSRISDPASPITVYIEGDGLAWRTRTEVSIDPTPTDPIGLRLAVADRGSNVLYLARPCQYPPAGGDPRCNAAYWTDRRFAEEVVVAMNAAIDGFAPRGVRLVGYSGGGAVAVLVAARRTDVIDIRTVAGNLDHATLNRHHGVTPQRGSLNPVDVAARLARVPQLHLVGGRDSIVVPLVAESYVRRAGSGDCIEIRRIENATHGDGWIEPWQRIATAPIQCRAGGSAR
ncbi:MAG: alpha/beta hydrolase [Azospirillum sp.]|nr:alpha/beta hydrolase [Azospirillum sp.]